MSRTVQLRQIATPDHADGAVPHEQSPPWV